jgi:hypothetical protein
MFMCVYAYLQARPVSSDTVQQILPKPCCCYDSLDMWMIVHLTATKFEPFVFLVLDFTFAYA